MENFDIGETLKQSENKGELNMSVSSICLSKDGNKYAYVTFDDGVRHAEGRIPDCRITKNDGFARIEVAQLEKYMYENLRDLKKMAAG
ncbi:MAG: hypothetical protein K6F37_07625, partial [Lachnospiraceae bacterium]|nr:hypothetical protein [Lachnospiraceae bacterium]